MIFECYCVVDLESLKYIRKGAVFGDAPFEGKFHPCSTRVFDSYSSAKRCVASLKGRYGGDYKIQKCLYNVDVVDYNGDEMPF